MKPSTPLPTRTSSRIKRSRDEGPPLLVSLLKDLPDVFEANVLTLLGIGDHIALAGVNRACRGALKEVEGVRWLLSRGEKWDEGRLMRPSLRRFMVCATAARDGDLKVLQWARANGCVWDWRTCACAAAGGHLEVLKWARENGCEWNWQTCAFAAEGGHLEVLQWARANGCEWWGEETCAGAARGGRLEVLRWARKNGCEWNWWTCHHAAMKGHLVVLQWARENGCEWDAYTCACAAGGGHLDVLRWAHENGCPDGGKY